MVPKPGKELAAAIKGAQVLKPLAGHAAAFSYCEDFMGIEPH
jgi:hypothetical protein